MQRLLHQSKSIQSDELPAMKLTLLTFLPRNSIHGSAICAFNISAINAAFSGPFKYQKSISSAWERMEPESRADCKASRTPETRHNMLIDSQRYQLMDQAVQPTTDYPLYFSKSERFTHIALDTVPTKLHERVQIIYVANTDGLIKKLSVLPRTKETCVIEMWQSQPDTNTRILTMQFLKQTESLYIGTDKSLIRTPAQHCNRHGSRASCLNAMDPYCGWDDLNQKCTTPPQGDTLIKFWQQAATECPVLNAPVNGGWSAWSEWYKCLQYTNDNQPEVSNPDSCLCRTRTCNNPSPKNGGAACKGMTTSVTNCTVNGGWTEWTAWSACSQTCGVAVKTRRRTCSNPKPAHGGRICVGTDHDEMYCSQVPPCPEPKLPPIDGGWGPWGPWNECSAQCGGGFRFRRRKCDDPVPQNGGLECNGCHLDYEVCNKQPCPEVKKVGPWTPWLMLANSSSDSSHLVKRFKFACRLNAPDTSNVKVVLAKEETRTCHANGICERAGDSNEDHGWTEWSNWSACSAECGGGQQYRTRSCERNHCDGTSKMARACNTQPCKGK